MRYAQTATLRRLTGYDDVNYVSTYTPPEGEPPLTVPCRKEPSAGRVINQFGVEVNAETYFFLPPDVPVDVGDILDDTAVRYASSTVSTRGVVRGYEAAV